VRGPEGTYDTAQVCMNGHLASGSFHDSPEFRKKFCDKCGEPTITQCMSCTAEIRGHYRGGWVSTRKPPVPSFCRECGKPFPWTSRRLEAASVLAAESELNEQEREQLESSLRDVLTDTPKTEVASVRIKRLLSKAGKEVGGALRKVIVDVASEAAKKTILGP
jgi:hypothetical protein